MLQVGDDLQFSQWMLQVGDDLQTTYWGFPYQSFPYRDHIACVQIYFLLYLVFDNMDVPIKKN